MSQPLWIPRSDRIAGSNLTRYLEFLRMKGYGDFVDYPTLYDWSTNDIDGFWRSIWEFSGIISSRRYDKIRTGETMFDTRWFTGAKLNFAENLLRFRDDRDAIIHQSEDGRQGRISYRELNKQVAACAAGMKKLGVQQGDRIAGFATNIPEAVIAMLATTSLGAIWSSCSPDFGLAGVLARFGQIEPKILFAVDGYQYNGKHFDCTAELTHIVERLPSLQKLVVIPGLGQKTDQDIPRSGGWAELLDNRTTALEFAQLPFDHPVYIMYSSGTTGTPKCIVHGAGGTILQHFKEHALHCDCKREDVISYYTTCGWMMWNWLIGSLFTGATIYLYDGSPAYPNLDILWDAIDNEKISIFGTSPKFLQTCDDQGLEPRNSHKLNSLKVLLSTGSPLPARTFHWVYEKVKADLQLSSISGGTDIISCFMLGCPHLPVHTEEIQCRGLGMKVEIADETGRIVEGRVGELVCTKPFPSMPVGFWDDPNREKYRAAYFEHFPGIWRHGDYIRISARGGVIVSGRSDATLNPGGVRIGTAEIYGPVESMAEIDEAIAVTHPAGTDHGIILFVVPAAGFSLTDELSKQIKRRIREQQTPRHVPARIFAVTDIPRTISGKKVELAVFNILRGQNVPNRDALANPESLEQFARLAAQLQE